MSTPTPQRRRCTSTSPSLGARCTKDLGHKGPHQWQSDITDVPVLWNDTPESPASEEGDYRCTSISPSLGVLGARCMKDQGHDGPHQWQSDIIDVPVVWEDAPGASADDQDDQRS